MPTTKPTPILDLYKEWMEKGKIPDLGLCWSLPEEIECSYEFYLISPTDADFGLLSKKGLSCTFWGSGLAMWDEDRGWKMTALRQTLILLLAALNGEFD